MNLNWCRQSGSRQLLSIAALCLLVPVSFSQAHAEEADTDLPGSLHSVNYRASAFSYHDHGTLVWLNGPDGMMRLDIRRGGTTAQGRNRLTALMEQNGEGWTAVFGGETAGTINAWGEQWRQPPDGLVRAARLIATVLDSGPPAFTPAKRPWRAGSNRVATRKYGIPSLTQANEPGAAVVSFRRTQVDRGMGRGGDGDILELAWSAAGSVGSSYLRVRSTKRPGQLELTPDATYQVVFAMPETFVPLWPMGQLVRFVP